MLHSLSLIAAPRISFNGAAMLHVPFENNKMASTLAGAVIIPGLFIKCKEAERWVKFNGNRKHCGEETEKV